MDHKIDQRYLLTHPMPHHFDEIQELCRRVYPFSKPWSVAQLESHRSYFPDGQLIVVDRESGKIVGLAFSLIIAWSDYSHQDNWQDFTSAGFFHNHNPKKGQTLYGAEVMVDPETRGQGIGKLLYEGRWKIVEKYGLMRIRAGARLRGYSKFKDKLTVEDYVKAVSKKEIYDPTLSFQLNQGFKVIDVAANYLYNDPESLGYAAVIELINPEIATPSDLEKQKQRVQQFFTDEKYIPRYLPKELRRLVRKITQTLGAVILDEEGERIFKRVEFYRERLKKTRRVKDRRILITLLDQLKSETRQDRLKLAHAFSLQLEMVNVCEAAHRTWRLRQKITPQGSMTKSKLTYVLTANPTEARSKVTVEALDRLEQTLIDGIHNGFLFNEAALISQVRMLWYRSLSKSKKPSIIDEAEYIYSLVFAPPIFDFILSEKPSYEIQLRTWVGGDKDGHPGINAWVMRDCLTMSRQLIVKAASLKIGLVLADLKSLEEIGRAKRTDINSLKKLDEDLKRLNVIAMGDGTRVKSWSMKLRAFEKSAPLLIKKHEHMLLLMRIIELFPGLVLPIELREQASKIASALNDKRSAIREMLVELGRISGALDPRSYARGLVISNCESSLEIDLAVNLIEQTLKSRTFPVVPLFESRKALIGSKKILKTWFLKKGNLEFVRRHWSSKFELMLGYTDTAKQNGALASRYLVSRAMADVGRVLMSHRIAPIFFHGSGGNVERGGGSLKEQISWWPTSAVETPKLTIQGEMIQRLFSTKEILHSHCVQLTNEILRRKVRRSRLTRNPELERFVELARASYSTLVSNPSRIARLINGTPYHYLDVLQTDSRLKKRTSSDGASPESLRTIPWVLSWTQSRILLPNWWGVGTAWESSDLEARDKLKIILKENSFFSSFVKSLGFTLAKVDLEIWELYFDAKADKDLIEMCRRELALAHKFFHEITDQQELIWYRPWLEESIRLRSPHIHLLNLLQILALKSDDEALLKETIVGIGCGMLTTS